MPGCRMRAERPMQNVGCKVWSRNFSSGGSAKAVNQQCPPGLKSRLQKTPLRIGCGSSGHSAADGAIQVAEVFRRCGFPRRAEQTERLSYGGQREIGHDRRES